METVGAIIQARMTSTRLPGKVLLPVCGKPLLFYLVDRLQWSSEISQIIVATSSNATDDPVERFCEEEGVACFRGSENDVLRRVLEAAEKFQLQNVMRLTADCPLIDPEVLDAQVRFFYFHRVDYCYLGLSYPEGICADLMTFSALAQANKNAIEAHEREHVTPYLHSRRGVFKISGLENESDDSKYRFVVDESSDFAVVSQILEALFKPDAKPFTMEDIKNFLDSRPEIARLNENLVRNEKYDVFAANPSSS